MLRREFLGVFQCHSMLHITLQCVSCGWVGTPVVTLYIQTVENSEVHTVHGRLHAFKLHCSLLKVTAFVL
jgi:hypothetical protein